MLYSRSLATEVVAVNTNDVRKPVACLFGVTIDNHGSGYLGMARCFSVHKTTSCHISAQKYFWIKLGAPVKKLSLMSLYVKFYKLKSQVLLHSPETSVQNRILF